MRALLVEDSDLLTRALARQYRAAGYDVACAGDGTHALATLLSADRFDLVSLDHDLGDGPNGEDVARAIANLPQDARPTAVFIHSGNDAGAARIDDVLHDAGIRVRRYQP